MQWSVRVNRGLPAPEGPLAARGLPVELSASRSCKHNTAPPAAFLMQQMAWREHWDEPAGRRCRHWMIRWPARAGLARRWELRASIRSTDACGGRPGAVLDVRGAVREDIRSAWRRWTADQALPRLRRQSCRTPPYPDGAAADLRTRPDPRSGTSRRWQWASTLRTTHSLVASVRRGVPEACQTARAGDPAAGGALPEDQGRQIGFDARALSRPTIPRTPLPRSSGFMGRRLADVSGTSGCPTAGRPARHGVDPDSSGLKSPVEVSAEILATAARAEDTFNDDLFGAVITVPASLTMRNARPPRMRPSLPA